MLFAHLLVVVIVLLSPGAQEGSAARAKHE